MPLKQIIMIFSRSTYAKKLGAKQWGQEVMLKELGWNTQNVFEVMKPTALLSWEESNCLSESRQLHIAGYARRHV